MKKEISPGIIVAIIVVILAVIGFIAKQTLFVDPNYTPNTPENIQREKQVKSESAIAKRLGRTRMSNPAPANSGQ